MVFKCGICLNKFIKSVLDTATVITSVLAITYSVDCARSKPDQPISWPGPLLPMVTVPSLSYPTPRRRISPFKIRKRLFGSSSGLMILCPGLNDICFASLIQW